MLSISAGEVIRCARGRRPSTVVSRDLGYKTNVVYRWETEKASPTWSQFVDFCEVMDRRVISDFSRFFRLDFPMRDGQRVVKHFAGVTPHSEVARRLNVPKSTVSKWVNGRQEPPCQTIFDLIAMAGAHLHAFLGRYSRFSKIPEVANHLQAQKLFSDNPGALALFNLLDLESYRTSMRDETWIASQCGFSVQATKHLISEMLRLRILERQDGKLKAVANSVMLLTADVRHRDCMGFWLNQARAQLLDGRIPILENKYRIFSADEQAIQEISQATEKYIHHLGGIIEKAQSRPQTKVLSLVLALNSALKVDPV